MNTWKKLQEKYPTVAFNYRKGKEFKHLCTFEPFTIQPQNWDVEKVKEFNSLITYNSKFGKKCKEVVKVYIRKGCLVGGYESTVTLKKFKSYDKKIKGVCVVGKTHHSSSKEGDIIFLRRELVEKLSANKYLKVHSYGQHPWGGYNYQGVIEPLRPWSESLLEKINEYQFCACFENTYHKLWSWGYLTEKLFNCFKAKTIPIYIGCYNIEELVPKDLFIDFRDFYRDYNKLAEYLNHFSRKKYVNMVEKAYKWNKQRSFGTLDSFEKLLQEVTKK